MVGENLKNAIKDMQKFQTVINFIEESLGKKNKITDISKAVSYTHLTLPTTPYV